MKTHLFRERKKYVHKTQMPLLPAKVNMRTEKIVKFKIELRLPFMVHHLVDSFEMICTIKFAADLRQFGIFSVYLGFLHKQN
jgi:hypothetical protein